MVGVREAGYSDAVRWVLGAAPISLKFKIIEIITFRMCFFRRGLLDGALV